LAAEILPARCASVPLRRLDPDAKIRVRMSGQIVVERESRAWRDRLRAYKVLVDGSRVASIRRGERITIPTAEGRHRVQLVIDWARSATLQVEVPPNGTVVLRCRPNLSQSAFKAMTSGREDYVSLWLASGGADPHSSELSDRHRLWSPLFVLIGAVLIFVNSLAGGSVWVVSFSAVMVAASAAWLFASLRGLM
jgi:hypothetical protein